MINREVTRTILNAAETTADTRTLSGSTLAFEIGAADKFYIGFPGRFASRYFKIGTANSNSVTFTMKTFNGTDFQPVKDFVDQTDTLGKSGWMHWENRDDWVLSKQAPINDKELYWAEFTVSGDLSAGTTLETVLNLFSDDTDLSVYYPTLVSDSRFLPDGQSDFLKQHEAAKNLVVLRLKQRKLIIFEHQIIDSNTVNVATVHACAKYIFGGLDGSEEILALKQEAEDDFDTEISSTRLNVDQNEDGKVDEAEKRDVGSETFVRRR